MDRLDKILSNTGRWSRREAAALIQSGRVKVNGAVAHRREEKYSETACFQVDGEQISGDSRIYLLLHKPAGLVSSTEDPREPTVLTLLPDSIRRTGVFPAGRLDKDTTGLLLLTNDGPLAHALLSPRRHVDKVYQVTVEGELDESDEAAFQAGMVLGDGLVCLPARLERLGPQNGLVTLREGKYHQIKRMFAARGKPVRTLHRIAFGPLRLPDELSPGSWRPLTPEERAAIQAVGSV